MCNVCNNPEAKFSMMGLPGKMCVACHDAVLQARKGDTEAARNYFNNISFASESAMLFIQKELNGEEKTQESHLPEEPLRDGNTAIPRSSEGRSVLSSSTESNMLQQIADDVKLIKAILVFFLIATVIGLGGTLIYVMQLANFLKDLF